VFLISQAANPYLAFAVMLATGLDGIKKGLTPPAPVEEDIYEFTDEEAEERGITCLADSLAQSLSRLDKDEVVKEALGDHLYNAFCVSKKSEWDRYRMAVSDWEIKEYLDRY